MVLVNYAGKEINAKLVYYGPGLSGKTTNLEFIYTSVPATHRGKMVSMKTKTERTLFFDFLPLDLGDLGGYRTRFLLYTVPGQVYYNATRKLVLKGVDAVVFVADSKRAKMDENRESLQNLRENLKELGLELGQMPWVLQYNKRDLPDAASVEELNRALNADGVPSILAVASRGDGVFDTFKEVSKLLLRNLSKNLGPSMLSRPAARPASQQGAPAIVRPPAPAEPVETTPAVSRAAEPVLPSPTVDAEPPRVPVPFIAQAPAHVPERASAHVPEPASTQAAQAPVLKPEAAPAVAAAAPELETIESTSRAAERQEPRFIVSDLPTHTGERRDRAFEPVKEPVKILEERAIDPREATVTDPAAKEEPAVPKEAARIENGAKPRNGFFGWLRRPKPALEAEDLQPQAMKEVGSPASSSFEDDLLRGEGDRDALPDEGDDDQRTADEDGLGDEELLSAVEIEPQEAPAKPHLELVRGVQPAAGEALSDSGVQEVTIPVVRPAGSREVRLVLRLLVSRESDGEDVSEPEILEASVGVRR